MGGIRGGSRHWLLKGSWLRECWMFILCCLFLCLCLCWFLSPEVPPVACGSLSATSSCSALKIPCSWIKVKLKTGPVLLETHSPLLGEALSCRKKMYRGQGIMRTARVVLELMCTLWVFPGKTECAGLLCKVGSDCSCLGEQALEAASSCWGWPRKGCMAWYKQYLWKVCGFYSSSCVSWALQTVLLVWGCSQHGCLSRCALVPGSCRDISWSQKWGWNLQHLSKQQHCPRCMAFLSQCPWLFWKWVQSQLPSSHLMGFLWVGIHLELMRILVPF